MLSSLGLAVVVSAAVGLVIVVSLVSRRTGGHSDCNIARVLYEAEHPGKIG